MSEERTFVSRAGRKLAAALDAFALDVSGAVCADFGCNVGGFTDCLLQRGARRVYAVDTGYGALAWTLRRCERVVVMERTNALHCPVPEPVDLVAVDVGWTPQARIVPAARRWLKRAADGEGRIVSLLKPHYEIARHGVRPHRPLEERESRDTCLAVCRELAGAGAEVLAAAESPLRGKGGNVEYLLWIAGSSNGRDLPQPVDGPGGGP